MVSWFHGQFFLMFPLGNLLLVSNSLQDQLNAGFCHAAGRCDGVLDMSNISSSSCLPGNRKQLSSSVSTSSVLVCSLLPGLGASFLAPHDPIICSLASSHSTSCLKCKLYYDIYLLRNIQTTLTVRKISSVLTLCFRGLHDVADHVSSIAPFSLATFL